MSLSRKDKQSINEWLEGQRGKPQYRPAPTAGIAVAKVVKPLSKNIRVAHLRLCSIRTGLRLSVRDGQKYPHLLSLQAAAMVEHW